MPKLLIIRFSALGDVAMTLPVVWSLAKQYPQLDITILSRKNYASLFAILPSNVHFLGADLEGEHKGLIGLHRLYYRELKPMRFDAVADLHWVLRSMLFYFRFKARRIRIAHIEKGHKEKKLLTRRTDKIMVPQETSLQRYCHTLNRLGYEFPMHFTSLFGEGKGDISLLSDFTPPKGEGEMWIGVAPFAKHKGKIYPLNKMRQVVRHFASVEGCKVFLFGAGKEERSLLESWKTDHNDVIFVTAGRLKMDSELILMSHIDAMITMDSANMHFASLVHTPVVSVWGATHPYAGFLGYGQSMDHCVQLPLECRPCSVFGNKPCYRRDYACLNQLPPERIIQCVEQLLHEKGGERA